MVDILVGVISYVYITYHPAGGWPGLTQSCE